MPGTYVGSTLVPSSYYSLVLTAAAKWGVPPELLAAQLNQESGFNPSATSSAGAEGIAQFLSSTAASMGVNPWDPQSAIDGMAHLDATYKKQFGSWDLALAAYNAGPGAVQQYNGVPPYQETQDYVKKILGASGVSASASATAISVTGASDPLSNLTKLYDSITNQNWWKRLAFGAIGVLIILFAVWFIFRRTVGKDVYKAAENIVGTRKKDASISGIESGSKGDIEVDTKPPNVPPIAE